MAIRFFFEISMVLLNLPECRVASMVSLGQRSRARGSPLSGAEEGETQLARRPRQCSVQAIARQAMPQHVKLCAVSTACQGVAVD